MPPLRGLLALGDGGRGGWWLASLPAYANPIGPTATAGGSVRRPSLLSGAFSVDDLVVAWFVPGGSGEHFVSTLPGLYVACWALTEQ
ncbi:hypothetical protein C2845_PM03G27830 [Panicum miliaceum]|uniref:Uncharacterized protein n=1 Tax=Panicum miliaceum TaxID=4540 RepID=A0A3L6T9M3_PANMI|nr:hypothetical protein C2845_PM03G27830 [Panicum miliaceum]